MRRAARSVARSMMGERIIRILRIGADFVSRNDATTLRKVFTLRRSVNTRIGDFLTGFQDLQGISLINKFLKIKKSFQS